MMWKENDKTTDKRIERITKDKTKPAPGVDRVVYAGLPEYEEKIEREERQTATD